MVDNRRGGYTNPEGNGRFMQQSNNNSLYDSEQAKLKEEL
jgi:polyadenylate-binding protein 2